MSAPARNAMLTRCWSSAGWPRTAQDCPTTAGEPPHLTVTIDWDALRTGLGVATLDYGTQVSAAEARRWACDAKIIPVVLGGKSEPLDVGRAMRTVPLSIRRALVARDRTIALFLFPAGNSPNTVNARYACRGRAHEGGHSHEHQPGAWPDER